MLAIGTFLNEDYQMGEESKALITQHGEMSVQAVVDRKRKLVEVMEAVMKEGEHYGRIPGCGPKPALFKAGAEVLAVTFGLAPMFKVERTELPGGHREYHITCTLRHIASGNDVAEGVGEASTLESKHRWRGGGRTCPKCGKAAIIKGKAEFGGGWVCFEKKDGCGAKWQAGDQAIEGQAQGRIENPDPADAYNTVLKMAKKRAHVDAILTAVGASDILTQDLDDLPDGSVEDAEFTETRSVQPRSNSGTAKPWAADLAKCKTPDDVRALRAQKIEPMREGPMKVSALKDWEQRLAEVSEAGGEYGFDPRSSHD